MELRGRIIAHRDKHDKGKVPCFDVSGNIFTYGKLIAVCIGWHSTDRVIKRMSTKKVVYFEDDNDMVELVRIILSREDFQVHGVSDGLAGIKLAQEILPDAILLDLMLPDMDGWEIFRQLKSNPSTAGIPVIVITAKAQSIDKVLGLEIAKVDDYISKPFRPNELVERINKILAVNE
jgi:CheY-like chemotaxis protein